VVSWASGWSAQLFWQGPGWGFSSARRRRPPVPDAFAGRRSDDEDGPAAEARYPPVRNRRSGQSRGWSPARSGPLIQSRQQPGGPSPSRSNASWRRPGGVRADARRSAGRHMERPSPARARRHRAAGPAPAGTRGRCGRRLGERADQLGSHASPAAPAQAGQPPSTGRAMPAWPVKDQSAPPAWRWPGTTTRSRQWVAMTPNSGSARKRRPAAPFAPASARDLAGTAWWSRRSGRRAGPGGRHCGAVDSQARWPLRQPPVRVEGDARSPNALSSQGVTFPGAKSAEGLAARFASATARERGARSEANEMRCGGPGTRPRRASRPAQRGAGAGGQAQERVY